MTELNIEWALLTAFSIYLFMYKFNANYRIRRLFKISLSKEIKLIDCAPCFSFWIALLITFNPLIAIFVYLFNVIIERND